MARLGLVRSFQISAVFPHLTSLENVRLALQRQRGGSYDWWRSEVLLKEYEDRARALLEDVGLTEYVETPAVLLSYGRKRALEIATTLALDPKMLLLDEPTAGMTHEDVDRIVSLIKRIGRADDLMVGTTFPSSRACATASRCWRAGRCWRRGTTPRCRATPR